MRQLLTVSVFSSLCVLHLSLPPQPSMISVVWSQIQRVFLSRFDRFEKLVSECYENEKLNISREEINEIFQKEAKTIPHTGGAGQAAAAGGAVSSTRDQQRAHLCIYPSTCSLAFCASLCCCFLVQHADREASISRSFLGR